MKKAAVAVAHRMLMIVYHIIRDGEGYKERGDDYFDKLHPAATAHRLMARLERLGYDVTQVGQRATVPVIPVPETPDTPGKRGPGRPCKCAARGLPCRHPPVSQKAPKPPSTSSPPPSANTVPRCHKCADWKSIVFMFARN